MSNYQSRAKKRGRQPSKLSVKLFLLDAGKSISVITTKTCPKKGIKKLMQDGFGPPQPGSILYLVIIDIPPPHSSGLGLNPMVEVAHAKGCMLSFWGCFDILPYMCAARDGTVYKN